MLWLVNMAVDAYQSGGENWNRAVRPNFKKLDCVN